MTEEEIAALVAENKALHDRVTELEEQFEDGGPEDGIDESALDILHAESAALRQSGIIYGLFENSTRGPLHPPVEPRFFNGSIVLYDGTTYRVYSRTIDAAGMCFYDIEPVTAEVLQPDKRWNRPLSTVGPVTILDGERLCNVSENVLEPLLVEHISLGRKTGRSFSRVPQEPSLMYHPGMRGRVGAGNTPVGKFSEASSVEPS